MKKIIIIVLFLAINLYGEKDDPLSFLNLTEDESIDKEYTQKEIIDMSQKERYKINLKIKLYNLYTELRRIERCEVCIDDPYFIKRKETLKVQIKKTKAELKPLL